MIENSNDIDAALSRFYADVAQNDLQPLWTQTKSLMPKSPRPQMRPFLWRWARMQQLAARAGELITIERGGERRVLALANPSLGGVPYATPTLWGALQYLNGRERAPAHRHTASAIRFVLEGDGVWTTVDGDACDMHPGDLVLTPSWTFHDHENGGDHPMMWFDGLDMPLVCGLDAMFYENYPDLYQRPEEPHNRSEARFTGGNLLPLQDRPTTPHSPLLVYRHEDTDRALKKSLTHRTGPMVSLEFVNPITGQSALPTLGCEIHRLVPEGRTRPQRRVGTAIYVVYRGAGLTIIDGERFDWSKGDMFAVPSWATVEHQATTESDLFAVTDAPTLRALHLYREELGSSPQEVVKVFPSG